MLRWIDTLQENTWTPEPLDMEMVKHSCMCIQHEPQQNICVVYDKERYLEVVIENDDVVGERNHFIIASDYFWTNEEADAFEQLVRTENMAFGESQIRSICEKYATQHPEWQLKYYERKPLRILDHIHQCQMKNSPKEILYKAGLDEIAARLDEVDEYNLIGGTPSSMLDGISLRTLKAINLPEGISLIADKERRSMLIALQSKASWLFDMKMEFAQCMYLEKLFKEEKDIAIIIKMMKSQYVKFADFWTSAQAKNYSYFLEQKECVEEYCGKTLEVKDFSDFYAYQKHVRQVYKYLIQDREKWNKAIEESNANRNSKLEVSLDEYTVRFPRSIEEFFAESENQKNCLLEYLEWYVYNATDILFLRKSSCVETTFITMEVYDGEIVQAYGRYNKAPEPEVQKWITKYAELVGLKVSDDCYKEY